MKTLDQVSLKLKHGVGAPVISLEMEGFAVPARRELTSRVEQLYEEHYDSVYRYLVLTGSSPVDANDFLQEAFLELFRSLKAGHRIGKPKNWLISVAHNIRADSRQKGNRERALTESELAAYASTEPDPRPGPEATLLEQEALDRVKAAMAGLTERQSQYLLLRVEGVKLREIAEMYDVSVQAVADACTRAVEKLAAAQRPGGLTSGGFNHA